MDSGNERKISGTHSERNEYLVRFIFLILKLYIMNFIKTSILVLAGLFLSIGICGQKPEKLSLEEQLYRPNFHFTPKSGWMNDPNGLFYLDGTYHLFFQYYPDGNKWGPMHWGHATSRNLIKWDEQPIALAPDTLGYIFSGSAVVDHENTSGFGDGKNTPIVAVFTYHNVEKERAGAVDVESQALAYSLDNGKTWTKYEANPVIKNPGIRDFRDPKVIRDKKRNCWIMVLAAQDSVHFYTSKNLKDWTFLSDFGKGIGGHGGVWECPDFFPIHVQGTDTTKWVLIQSLNPGGINGGSATQYFVGDFDGTTFTLDPDFSAQLQKEGAVWLDWGMDNYASVSFDNTPENQRVIMGWMTNWEYAQEMPTEKWRGAMTLPRKVFLTRQNGNYILRNVPLKSMEDFYGKSIKKTVQLTKAKTLLKKGDIDLTKAVLDIDLHNPENKNITFTLGNMKKEQLSFGYDATSKTFFVDRWHSGIVDFEKNFATKRIEASLHHPLQSGKLKVILDKTSIELFLNDGETVLTNIFFPTEPYTELQVTTGGKKASLKLNAHQLNINP